MNTRTLWTALAWAPLLLALEPRADDVTFRPADGSSLAKDYTIDLSVALGDVTVYFDGQDVSEGVPADFELLAELALTVTDEYVETIAGVPRELIRTFDSMELHYEAADESGEADEFAELEGKSVKFVWNEEEGTYDVSYHDGEGDEELLQGLGADMDLRVLLPPGDVSEGDTWTLESGDLAALLFFGTEFDDVDLGDGDEVSALIESELLPQFEALRDGFTAECTYKGGGVIGVTVRGEGSIDLTAFIEELAYAQMPEGVEMDMSVDEAMIEVAIDGEGELHWDLAAGHLSSFEMSAEIEVLADVYVSADVMGETHDFEGSIELLGDATWEAVVAE